jgi:hypothetical protein
MGFCVFPVAVAELVDAILPRVPPLLASSSSGLVPLSIHNLFAPNSAGASISALSVTPDRGSPVPPEGASDAEVMASTLAKYSNPNKKRPGSSGLGGQSQNDNRPRSCIALQIVLEQIIQSFDSCSGLAQNFETATTCITSAGKAVDRLLLIALKQAHDELEDVVYFGEAQCKDWIAANTLW